MYTFGHLLRSAPANRGLEREHPVGEGRPNPPAGPRGGRPELKAAQAAAIEIARQRLSPIGLDRRRINGCQGLFSGNFGRLAAAKGGGGDQPAAEAAVISRRPSAPVGEQPAGRALFLADCRPLSRPENSGAVETPFRPGCTLVYIIVHFWTLRDIPVHRSPSGEPGCPSVYPGVPAGRGRMAHPAPLAPPPAAPAPAPAPPAEELPAAVELAAIAAKAAMLSAGETESAEK